jgi:hypothetical protein
MTHNRFVFLASIWSLASARCLFGQSEVAADIEIQVRSAGHEVVAAYVALVSDDEPWSRPLREVITDESGEAKWRVPPGKYRLVAGAPDYWWEKLPAIELQASARPRREVVELRRLGRISGKLTDIADEPIAGARVGHLRAFLVAPSILLSEMGERHLAGNWEIRSETDGSFELPALPGHRHSALIEAEGYEPGLIENFFPQPDRHHSLDLKLARGASLTVTWPLTAELAPGLLQLKPHDRGFLSKVPLVAPEWIWERAAAGGKAEWTSLPSGQYELFWIGSEPAKLPAKRLGSFVLDAGSKQRHEIVLPALAAAPPAPPAPSGTPLALKLEGEIPLRFENLEAKTLTPAGWSLLQGKLERASGGPRLELEDGYRPGGRVVVTASGVFGATAELQRGPPDRAVDVALVPRADIRGILQVPPGEKMPSRALLNSMSCPPPGEAHLAQVTIPIEIQPSGAWQAPIPAGCTCLVLELESFASLTWHKVVAKLGEVAAGGTRRLESGGDFLVRLTDSDGQAISGARVDVLSFREAESLARATGPQEHIATLERAESSAEGWAELRALPPSRYVLRVIPRGRRIPLFSDEHQLAANQQVVIDPWVVPVSGALDLRLKSKQASWDAFQAVLEGEAGEPRIRLEQRPDAGGRALFQEVPPGPWMLRVFYRPAGYRNEVASRKVAIAASQVKSVEMTIEAKKYRAQIVIDGDKFRQPGEVELFSRQDEAPPITARIDDEGSFIVYLPAAGKFTGRFFFPELKRRLSVPEVAFEEADRVTEISLPSSSIEGVVLSSDGAPIDQGSVMAAKLQQEKGQRPIFLNQIATSDALGRFKLELLPEGSWILTARTAEGKSEKLEVALGDSEQKTGVVLRLEATRQIQGRVVTATGQPVSGALVILVAPSPDRNDHEVARSAPDGTFSFQTTKAEVSSGSFWVQAPGGPVAYQTSAGNEVVLTAPAEFGELRLAPGESADAWQVAFEDGSSVTWNWLVSEAGPSNSIRLAPGRWTLRRQGEAAGQLYEIGPGDILVVKAAS